MRSRLFESGERALFERAREWEYPAQRPRARRGLSLLLDGAVQAAVRFFCPPPTESTVPFTHRL